VYSAVVHPLIEKCLQLNGGWQCCDQNTLLVLLAAADQHKLVSVFLHFLSFVLFTLSLFCVS